MADITFEITKELGVISEATKGWTRELNMVSWNGHEPKYDIRDWSPDHTRMSKGVSFTEEEVLIGFKGDDYEAAKLLKYLFDNQVMVSRFYQEKENLESLFLEITGGEEDE